MRPVTPVVPGLEKSELCWAKNWPGLTLHALHVNPEDGCDTLVMRFKPTFRERVEVLLGQDIFVWIDTFRDPMSNSVRWPKLFATPPIKVCNGCLVPHPHYLADVGYSMARGAIVESQTASGKSSTRQEAFLERELNKTVKEKLEEKLANE